jgi:alkylhydroperoxidase family enzyme
MSRIEGVPDGAGGPKVRTAYRLVRPALDGRVPTSMRVAARRPGLLWATGIVELANQRSMKLPGRLTELAVLKSASVLGCPFCLDIGSWVARTQHEVTEEELLRLHDHHEAPCFSAADRVAFDLAEAMSVTPTTVDDALWSRLREHYSDDEIVELVHIVAWENYRSRFNISLGLGPDGFNDGAACAVALDRSAESEETAVPRPV